MALHTFYPTNQKIPQYTFPHTLFRIRMRLWGLLSGICENIYKRNAGKEYLTIRWNFCVGFVRFVGGTSVGGNQFQIFEIYCASTSDLFFVWSYHIEQIPESRIYFSAWRTNGSNLVTLAFNVSGRKFYLNL